MGCNTCAVCGSRIGGPGSLENVMVVRHVRLPSGRAGWVAMHVRCAGKWPRAEAARKRPPGETLELEPLEIPSLPSLTLEEGCDGA